MHKAYVVIYTCTSTRAVSLEVVHDATAVTFLQCLSRFISRRGCPSLIVSDNGSVFRADLTQEFVSSRMITWKFNVDGAPWFGGLFERLVSCVKRCLKKMIGVRRITYVELQTLICMIELILNNRPIGQDYEDDQEDILTPNHLIYGRRLETSNAATTVDTLDEIEFSRRRRLIDTMLGHFWNRWRREYVTSLREHQRSVSKACSTKIKKNDIVIGFDDPEIFVANR